MTRYARPFRYDTAITAITLGVAIMLSSPPGSAMTFHRHGNQLIATGKTSSSDPATLRAWLDRASEASRPITTVVFRNGPGGAASGGVGMGRIIRDRGLNTILDGGCYSACADSFAAGVRRGMTRFDLPAYSLYDRTTLGIHGAARGGKPVPYPGQEIYLDYYRGMLGTAGAHAMPRITQAHYELREPGGFLYYYDPAAAQQPARFCSSRDTGSAGGCIHHPHDVTIRSDTLVNQPGYASVNDTLNVRTHVRGDLNPHYGRISHEDAWGIVRLRAGSVWSLDQASSADLVWVNGGTLQLKANGNLGASQMLVADRGGVVALDRSVLTTDVQATDSASVTGSGVATGRMLFGRAGLLAPQGIAIRPYTLRDERGVLLPKVTASQVTLSRDSTSLFDVSPDTRNAALRLEQHEVIADFGLFDWSYVRANVKAQMFIHQSAVLALNIAPGYYTRGHEVPLVSGTFDRMPATQSIDTASLCGKPFTTCRFDSVIPATYPYIVGSFEQAMRLGDASEVVDLTQPGAVVHARRNSLLSFTVRQSTDEITLIANPAFDDISIFSGARSGDGLGAAIRTASYRPGTALAPLLGALQFADKDTARAQAGALRGDGYATLRSADVNLVRQFGGTIDQHLQSLRRGQNEQPAAFADSLLAISQGANRDTVAGNMSRMLNRLAATPAETTMSASGTDGIQFWGRGFGATGRIDAQQGIAGMRQNSSGLLLGAERRFAGGRILLGATVGFGSASAKAGDKQFRAEIGAIDTSAYIDARYDAGYINGAIGHTRLDHDATRNIEGIAGLGGANKASYRHHAWSVRLEHGLQWSDRLETIWQPLLPVIDYVRLTDQRFAEASGPAALRGRGGSHESLRGGVGLGLWRNIRTSNSGVLMPHAQLLFTHEFKDRDGRLLASFAQEPSLRFKVMGQDVGRNTVSWNLGVGSQMNSRTSIAIDYVGERSSGSSQHGVMLGLAHKL